jgi:hypothetical protein
MYQTPAVGLFGVNTDKIKQKLVEAIDAVHRRHVEAQLVSGATDQSHYGLIWKALPPACINALLNVVVTTDTVNAGRAGYKLPVIDGTVIFPWRPPNGGNPSKTRFITSPSRGLVFDLKANVQEMLDLAGFVSDVETLGEIEMDLVQLVGFARDENLRVVVVAVESDVTRLRCISWGEVIPNDDGTVRFIDPETLFSGDEARVDTIASVPDVSNKPDGSAARSFDEGLPPKPFVKKRTTAANFK